MSLQKSQVTTTCFSYRGDTKWYCLLSPAITEPIANTVTDH